MEISSYTFFVIDSRFFITAIKGSSTDLQKDS